MSGLGYRRELKRLARNGDVAALAMLGYCYATGRAGRKRPRKAVAILRRAAEAGSVEAQYNLALLHWHGEGTPQDPEQAEKLLLDIAPVYPKAYLALGLLGQDQGRDPAVVRDYFRRAVAGGENAAYRYLGRDDAGEATPLREPESWREARENFIADLYRGTDRSYYLHGSPGAGKSTQLKLLQNAVSDAIYLDLALLSPESLRTAWREALATNPRLLLLDGCENLPELCRGEATTYRQFAGELLQEARATVLAGRISLGALEAELVPGESLLADQVDEVRLEPWDRETIAALPELATRTTSPDPDEIMYYTGGLPGLLQVFLQASRENLSHGAELRRFYRQYKDWLRATGRFDAVTEVLFSPLPQLSAADFAALVDEGILRHDPVNGDYYCLSRHFSRSLADETAGSPLIVKVLGAEKSVKMLIRRESFHLYPVSNIASWNRALRGDFRFNWELYDRFLRQDARNRGGDASYLNVLNFRDSVRILERFWEAHFADYFDAEPFTEWAADFELCSAKRNPLAHGQEERLTAADRQRLNRAAERITRQIGKALRERKVAGQMLPEIAQGTAVTFFPETGSGKGGVNGFFWNGNRRYPAIVYREALETAGLVTHELLQLKSREGRVTGYNERLGRYLVGFPPARD